LPFFLHFHIHSLKRISLEDYHMNLAKIIKKEEKIFQPNQIKLKLINEKKRETRTDHGNKEAQKEALNFNISSHGLLKLNRYQ